MSAERATVRVMSYNLLSLRMSIPAVVAVITTCQPDVLCVQEAPRFLFARRRAAKLAAALGLRVAAGHRRAGAVLVLVGPRAEVIGTSVMSLPWQAGRHRRGVACALLEVDGNRLAVASVHLSLYADERQRHLPRIVAAVERFGAPVVIAGDLNEQDTGDVWQELANRYQDAYATAPEGPGETFSARRPMRRIDAIFADRSITVVNCRVPDLPEVESASDHRPVLASLAL